MVKIITGTGTNPATWRRTQAVKTAQIAGQGPLQYCLRLAGMETWVQVLPRVRAVTTFLQRMVMETQPWVMMRLCPQPIGRWLTPLKIWTVVHRLWRWCAGSTMKLLLNKMKWRFSPIVYQDHSEACHDQKEACVDGTIFRQKNFIIKIYIPNWCTPKAIITKKS